MPGSRAPGHVESGDRLAAANAAIMAAPRDANLYLNRGELHRQMGHWTLAAADYDRAAEIDPQLVIVDAARALAFLEAGRPGQALEAVSRYLDCRPDDGRALLTLARALRDLHRQPEAIEAYDKTMPRLDPLLPEHVLERAETILALGDAHLGEAIAALDEGMAVLGPIVSLQVQAVELELRRGRIDEALGRLSAIQRQARRDEPWLIRQGEVLERAGALTEARSAFAQAGDIMESLPCREQSTRSSRALRARINAGLDRLGLSADQTNRDLGALPGDSCDGGCTAPARPAGGAAPAERVDAGPEPLPSAVVVQLTRGPYLQQATTSSVVVRWRTVAATDSRVVFGQSPDELTQLVADPAITTEHVVMVDGLQAGTRYYYTVGSTRDPIVSGDGQHYFRTLPLAGVPTPTRIWALGDSGTANASAAAVRDGYLYFANAQPPDVWLMLGDNAYTHGTDAQYQAAVFDMYPQILQNTALWPTLGNHDALSADSPTQSGVYYSIFSLPNNGEAGGLASGTEAYYSFDYGDIHFICLDSQDTNRSPAGAMMTWLAADLADTAARWIIAYWHHPPYTKGSHDSDDVADSSGRMRDMREIALPILEEGGVDLVLTGHSHAYERSYLLDGHYGTSVTLTPAMILDHGNGNPSGDGAYWKPIAPVDAHAGAVYVVAGSSGQTGGGPLNHPAMYVSMSQLGSFVIDVNGNRLQARFLNSDGDVLDDFTVLKPSGIAGDANGDWLVNIDDLLAVISAWNAAGQPGSIPADVNDDGTVNIDDLLLVINNWG